MRSHSVKRDCYSGERFRRVQIIGLYHHDVVGGEYCILRRLLRHDEIIFSRG